MTKTLVGLGVVGVAAVIVISAAAVSQDKRAAESATGITDDSSANAAHPVEQIPQPAEGAEAQPVGNVSANVANVALEATKPRRKPTRQDAGRGLAAVEEAASAERYLFVFFYKNEDEQTRKMREFFDAAARTLADRADAVAVNTSDLLEKKMVDRFNVSRAPMPLVLAIAPNGAITGGFPAGGEFDENKLRGVFASPCMEKCLKALQERKLVLLCVQNKTTKSSDAAMQGVHDFKADARFAQATEIVTVDPSEAAEAETLRKLRIDPETPDAITVFLSPPGSIIARFTGATNKDLLVATVQKAASGCGPSGCGPRGCGPRKK